MAAKGSAVPVEQLATRPAQPPARRAAGPSVAVVLVALSVFGTGFARPTLVENVAIGDLAILAMIAGFGARVLAGGTVVGDAARRLALPVVLIAIGSLVAAAHVGFREWIVGDLARDAAVGLAFLAALDTIRGEGQRAVRAATGALAASASIVSVQLLTDTGIRADATFPNPNVAGHFLATALIGLLVLPMRSPVRSAVVPLVLLGLLRTSSFGALLQLAVGLLYLGITRTQRWRRAHRHGVVVASLVAGALLIGLAIALPSLLPEENSERSGLSTSRLERSADGRFSTWEEGIEVLFQHPLGVGAGSTNGLRLLEAEQELHNEPLAYLVERGVIGLAGWVTLAVSLWRLAPAGGAARALLLGLGLSSMVRETSHYRHLWLVLALLIAVDGARRWDGRRD